MLLFFHASRARVPGGAVGGRQYIAVSTGHSPVSSELNTLAEELHPGNASNIFVFALPEPSSPIRGTTVGHSALL